MKNYALLAILMCFSLITKAQTSSGKHHIKYLDINSGNPDIGVSFLENNTLVFATATTDKIINLEKRNPHLDLYTGKVDEDGVVTDKQRMTGAATKGISKVGATFTKDGKSVYFAANKYRKKSKRKPLYVIFKADIDSLGNWSEAEKMPFNVKNASSSYPTLDAENKRIYFSSDRAGGFGGTDIYYVNINEDGTYSDAVNIGDKINTSGNETTPYVGPKNFLYFSSDSRDDNLGGLDIYASEVFENTVSEPLHLSSPINGANDDFSYMVNEDSKGFFSSNRLQGRANDDIYSFYIEPDKPKECLQEIVGTVRDKETEELISGATVKVVDDGGLEVNTITTDENGSFKVKLNCSSTFTIRTNMFQYAQEEHIVNTANYFAPPPLEVNQLLNKKLVKEIKEVSKDKFVVDINPIYFYFDSHYITNKAKKELDKIVKVMKENPEIKIEAGSHTDAFGSESYNMILSERRAQSTVDYIVSKGIDADRIIAKGYGETQLLNGCTPTSRCTKAQHRLNRRTEFVIINKEALYIPPTENELETVITEKQPEDNSKSESYTVEDSNTNGETNDQEIETEEVNEPETPNEPDRFNDIDNQEIEKEPQASNNADAIKDIQPNNYKPTIEENTNQSNTYIAENSSSNNDLEKKTLAESTDKNQNNNSHTSDSSEYENSASTTANQHIFDEDEEETDKIEIGSFNRDLDKNNSQKNTSISNVSDKLFGDGDDYYEPEKDNTQQVISAISQQMVADTYMSETKETIIKINGIDITPLSIKKNGKYVETTRAFKTDVMRINFQVAQHTELPKNCTDVYILIQNPDGVILNRKGEFAECTTGEKLMYTERTEAIFRDNRLNISMVTDRFIQKIIKGTYTILIYVDGYPVGLEMINLS